MSTLTTTRAQTLPRVNLLPPEIAERARFRRVQAGLGTAVVAALGVVALLYVAAANQVGAAEEQLAAVRAEGGQLGAEQATYNHVPAVYAEVAAAEARLTQAMGREIRWSHFLNDLSLTIPDNVWLERLTIAQTDPAAAAAGAAPGGASASLVPGGIGSVQFEGKAMSHNDVAKWLDSLAKQRGYTNPYFTKSETEKDIAPGAKSTVTFSSQATVTDEALSNRYTAQGGRTR